MKHPILKEEFKKRPRLEIDPEDNRPIGWQGEFVDAFFDALGQHRNSHPIFDTAWDVPLPLPGGEGGGVFLRELSFADQMALADLLEGWTLINHTYEFDNGETLQGTIYVPPLEITHREATPVEAAGGVKEGEVIDEFLAVVGELKEGAELWQVEDEQVWIKGRGISREQRQALRYYGWYNLMNNEVDGVVMGFNRWALPAHMLPPKGRRTARPEPTNPGTPDEQLARVLPNPLSCWTWDGKSLVANGDQVEGLYFEQKNVEFPHQCDALRSAGWSENITKNFSTGLVTWRYSVPNPQYMPANIFEALTLLQPRRGWFDEGRCIEEGDNRIRWRKDLDERAFSEAVSLARQASRHPCFSVSKGWDEITYTFKPDNGF